MIGVYTALFGPYDNPLSPYYSSADFVLFTDQPGHFDGWRVERVEPPHEDPRYASRYYFDQSCRVMPDYEYTIMHGANARLTTPPEELVKVLPDDVDIACFPHRHRQNVYQEAEVCKGRKDKADVIDAQISRYKSEGLPVDVRLSACILLVRRNTPRLREFEDFWWNEVKNGSCRDQLSFDYSRWKLGVDVVRLPTAAYGSIFKVSRHK